MIDRRDSDPGIHPDERWMDGFADGVNAERRSRRPGLGGLVFALAVTAVFWLAVGFFAGRASAAGPSAPAPEPSFVPVPTYHGETDEPSDHDRGSEPALPPGADCAVPSGLRSPDAPVPAPCQRPSSDGTARRPTDVAVRPRGDRAGTGASPAPVATPRPKPAPVARGHVRTGTASWYDDPRKAGLYAAAGPPLRVGDWRGRTVTVNSGGHSFRVVLSDWCACRDRVIDLSPAAFSRLAPLSRGLTRVTVTW